jgi:translation initiation factor SUI1
MAECGISGYLQQGFVHIRVQQRHWHLCPNRNSNEQDQEAHRQDAYLCQGCKTRKSITTVTGLSDRGLDLKRILRAIKQESCCNGTVWKDKDNGTYILQFHGDQRDQVRTFLLKEDICDRNNIKVHGFRL